MICPKCRNPLPGRKRRRTDELSVLQLRMRAYHKVGNDRSYIGVALMCAVIEG